MDRSQRAAEAGVTDEVVDIVSGYKSASCGQIMLPVGGFRLDRRDVAFAAVQTKPFQPRFLSEQAVGFRELFDAKLHEAFVRDLDVGNQPIDDAVLPPLEKTLNSTSARLQILVLKGLPELRSGLAATAAARGRSRLVSRSSIFSASDAERGAKSVPQTLGQALLTRCAFRISTAPGCHSMRTAVGPLPSGFAGPP